MGLRAFKYQRVSDDRAQGRSVDEQERENDRVIERNGWQTVGSLTDNDRGASRYSGVARPAWDELVSRLEAGEADVLVTWEASRSTRDLEVYVPLRKVCRANSVLWCYNGRLYDLDDGDDSFMTTLQIALAEKEVEQTRKRVLRSTQANAERGLPHGKLLTGYRRIYSGNGVFIEQVKDPIWQPIIEEAFRRKLAGDLDMRIAADFAARGLKTRLGKDWSVTQMKRLLMNPGYAGLRVHRGQVLGHAVWYEHAYITEAEHYQILASYEARKQGKRHDGAIKYLLSGAAFCGVCGGKIGVGKPRGYLSYYCRTKFCVSRKLADLDHLITELVLCRLEQPDIMSLLASDNEAALEAIDKVAELRGRLDGFYQAAAAGELTPQALSSIEATLAPQIERCETQARQINLPGPVHELVANPRTIWPKLNIIQKREVIGLLMRIDILKTRRGERTLNPEAIRVTWLHSEE